MIKVVTLILVLWEATDASDTAIAMAEPVEGMPAAQCVETAKRWNEEGGVFAFCLPEGKEPRP
jgi:hypothetical protein